MLKFFVDKQTDKWTSGQGKKVYAPKAQSIDAGAFTSLSANAVNLEKSKIHPLIKTM